MARNKSLIVAVTNLKYAMRVKMVNRLVIGMAIAGPLSVTFMLVGMAFYFPRGDPLLAMIISTGSTLLPIFAMLIAMSLSANAIVGEREENTLEVLLCTPITDRELLLGKTLSSFIPAFLVLYFSALTASLLTHAILLFSGEPPILFPDLPGLLLIFGTGPLMILAVISVMIIISGRASRVYAAYQAAAPLLLVFMIPLFAPIILFSGIPNPIVLWLTQIATFIFAAGFAVITWVIAVKRFDRDTMISRI